MSEIFAIFLPSKISSSLSNPYKRTEGIENYMASSNNSASLSQPSIPIFNGEGYEHWSIMIKTLFRSHDLWELVDKGFSKQDEEPRLKEN